MTIKQELNIFLASRLKELGNKDRDVQLINFYYGFGDDQWPTLEETATRFEIGTRERVRQLLESKFRKSVHLDSFPRLASFFTLLYTRDYWVETELVEELILKGFVVNGDFSLKGLFNLLEDVGLINEYEIYTPHVKQVTRSTLDKFKNNFIFKKTELAEVKKLFTLALRVATRCGVANINFLSKEFGNFKNLVLSIIKSSDKVWFQEDGYDFWYLFEDRENVLINYSEKLFSVIDKCNSSRLAVSYRNALDGRTFDYAYPPVEIIQQYLESSVYFRHENDELYFIGETTSPSSLELDIVEYFKKSSETDFPSITEYLNKFGSNQNTVATVRKTVSFSPFIYIDKSLGRQKHKYSLVGILKSLAGEKLESSRYQMFLEMLRKLLTDGTDKTIEQIARREQHILREWLFEGKTTACCAICGHEYMVQTLVTAHKKPRAVCNDAERLDPYIVMPVCLMGCDYLYENDYIYIQNGTVAMGAKECKSKELDYIKSVVGKQVDSRWLLGSKSYFRSEGNLNL